MYKGKTVHGSGGGGEGGGEGGGGGGGGSGGGELLNSEKEGVSTIKKGGEGQEKTCLNRSSGKRCDKSNQKAGWPLRGAKKTLYLWCAKKLTLIKTRGFTLRKRSRKNYVSGKIRRLTRDFKKTAHHGKKNVRRVKISCGR